ncbi:hypothetical protein JR334_06870 [Clostridia bacterium]|nr:hypothetical protein JR334_06870 [Clostridia bacterium]
MAVFSFPSKKQSKLVELLNTREGFEYLKAMTAENMLVEADRLLQAGKRDKALTLIRKAKEKMLLNNDTEIDLLLKVPKLLQRAERKNEAWMFLLKIKEYFYQRCDGNNIPSYMVMTTESAISNGMSEFLRIEKKLGYSFYMNIKSYLEDTTATFYLMNAYMQKEICEKNPQIKQAYIQARKQSEAYMNIKISDSYIKNIVFAHLVRIKKRDQLPEVLALVKETISHIPKIDYIKLEEDLLEIMQ